MLPKTESINDEIIVKEYTEIFTVGYPRSGNTWLGRLLSDLLNCPWQEIPEHPILYYGSHQNGKFVVRKRHTNEMVNGLSVFIYRDPRDVCVSRYFYYQHSSLQETIEKMYSPGEDDLDSYGPYESYIRSIWGHPEKYTVLLAYEDLHKSPILTLRGIVYEISGTALPNKYILESYERQKFENVLEKYPDYKHSMRKGIVGDWMNHFERDDGLLFHEYFGELLLDQGYIENGDWWEGLPI